MKLITMEVNGMILTKIDTDSLFDKNGIQGINEFYMRGRTVNNPAARVNEPWGVVEGCYRREASRPGVIAFNIKTSNGKKVNWDIDSCDIQSRAMTLPGNKPQF